MIGPVFTIVLGSAFADLPSVGSCQQTCRGMKTWAGEFWERECVKMVRSHKIKAEAEGTDGEAALMADAYHLVRRYYVMKNRAEACVRQL